MLVPKRNSDVVITFTTSPETKKALDEYAADEDRSMSWLVRNAIENVLDEKGYLSTKSKKKQKRLDSD